MIQYNTHPTRNVIKKNKKTVQIMFIKSTKVKDYEYINLVESYRGENGTTKHRVLYNFGRRDQLCENKSFKKIVLKLCELADIKVLDEENISAED